MKKYIKLFIENLKKSEITALANNLSYVSIFSIFPILALIIAISKGFNLNTYVYQKIGTYIPTAERQLAYILNIANNLINSLNSGILAGVGIIVMFFSIINLLMLLEKSFNIIWNVKNKRNIARVVINYLALILIFPIMLILILATNDKILYFLSNYSNIGIITVLFINLSKFLIIIVVLTLMYFAMPNTSVSLKSSVISSVVVSIILWILSYMYSYIQFSLSNYNAIYGSLAFVPLFLVWIKYFWIIILFGTQLSYTLDYPYDEMKYEITTKNEKELSILILNLICKRFVENKPMYDIDELSESIEIEKFYIKKILQKLEQMDYIYQVIKDDDKKYYQVIKNPNDIYIKEFLYNYENPNNATDLLVDSKNEKIKEIQKILDIKEDIKIINL